MNDKESQLLAETKQEFNQPEPEQTSETKVDEVDVEALLRAQGLSNDTQHKNTNTKWVVLAVMTVVLIGFMLLVTQLLSSMAD